MMEDVDFNAIIPPEDQEFLQAWPKTDAEQQRFNSICERLIPIVRAIIREWAKVMECKKRWRQIAGPPTPAELEDMRAYENKLRKVLEKFEFLLQIGVGASFEDMIESTWLELATTIMSQQANREGEVQKIYLAKLSKSLARCGPFHLASIEIMINLAVSIRVQGRIELSVNVLSMAYILLKNGDDKDKGQVEGMTVLEWIRIELLDTLLDHPELQSQTSHEVAERFLREHVALLEAEATGQGGAAKAAKAANPSLSTSYFAFVERLGICLLAQNKYHEAEEVLDRALRLYMEGIKTVDQQIQELQGVSIKDLAGKMREAGLAIPAGIEKEDLIKMYAEQTYHKAITKEEKIFLIMSYLGRSLFGQKQDHPEKLPKAEFLHRQVLEAKLKHREYGPEDGGTLGTMTDLKDALCGQHKYVEALSINERALTIRKRKYSPSNPAIKENIDRQIEMLRLQAAFRAAAEKTDLGPRSSWVGDEDGTPAQIMFEKTIQDAKQKRASSGTKGSSTKSSRTRSSKFDAPQYSPIEYDPTDKVDVSYAALMAGLGVAGVCMDKIKVGGSEVLGCTFKCLESRLPRNDQKDQASKCWASTLSLVHSSLQLPTEFSQDSAAGKRTFILLSALSMNKLVKELISDAQPLVRLFMEGSRDAFGRTEEEKVTAGAGDMKLQEGIKRSKPMRTCIACGAYGAIKKCSRCKKVYACSQECHVSAWNAFHKHSCVPKPK